MSRDEVYLLDILDAARLAMQYVRGKSRDESSCRVGPLDPRGSAAATVRVGAKHPPYISATGPPGPPR
jgi:hypothetical protein